MGAVLAWPAAAVDSGLAGLQLEPVERVVAELLLLDRTECGPGLVGVLTGAVGVARTARGRALALLRALELAADPAALLLGLGLFQILFFLGDERLQAVLPLLRLAQLALLARGLLGDLALHRDLLRLGVGVQLVDDPAGERHHHPADDDD